MSDLLRDLRSTADWGDLCEECEGCRELRRKAADEIERLRTALQEKESEG